MQFLQLNHFKVRFWHQSYSTNIQTKKSFSRDSSTAGSVCCRHILLWRSQKIHSSDIQEFASNPWYAWPPSFHHAHLLRPRFLHVWANWCQRRIAILWDLLAEFHQFICVVNNCQLSRCNDAILLQPQCRCYFLLHISYDQPLLFDEPSSSRCLWSIHGWGSEKI